MPQPRTVMRQILEALSQGPADTGTLAALTGLPSRRVSSRLCRAATLGYVKRDDKAPTVTTARGGRPLAFWRITDTHTMRIERAVKLLQANGYTLTPPSPIPRNEHEN